MTTKEYASKIDEIRKTIKKIVDKINSDKCAVCPSKICTTGEELKEQLNDILPYLQNNDKGKYIVLSGRLKMLFSGNRLNPYSFGAIIDIVNLIKEKLAEEQVITNNSYVLKVNNEFKINSLFIDDFHILKDFKITFKDNLNLMIGENGSGKSTIIEAIALIFGHLYKYFVESDDKAPFIEGYTISFTSRNSSTDLLHTVTIISNYCKTDDYRFDPKIIIDGGEVVFDKNAKNLIRNLLPSKVVLYYAGITEHLKELSGHFEKKYEARVTKSGNDYSLMPLNLPAPRPFMYTRNEHLGIFLLCLLLDYKNNSHIVKDLKIDPFEVDVTFEFKKPRWAKSDVNDLWGAEGKLAKQTINLLSQEADDKDVKEEYIKVSHPLTYLKDEFYRIFNSDIQHKVFEVFDFLLYNGLLGRVNLKWKFQNDNVELDRMSEGEKQLLTIRAISTLWQNKRSLLLLDEPDTFLHPKWQQDFITTVNNNAVSQIIITSHSPNIVSSINKKQLKILSSGKTVNYTLSPFGKKADDILINHFGTKTTRNKEIQEEINIIEKLLSNDDKVFSDDLKFKINELEKKLGLMDHAVILIKLEYAKRSKQLKDEKN